MLPNEQCFKASILCQDETNGTAFTFDYGYREAGGTAPHVDTGTAAGAFQTLVQASYVAILPERVKLVRYRFATVYGPFKGEVGFVETGGLAGDVEVTTNLLPQEVAIAFKRSTGHASRRDRGRVFFGPVDSTLFQMPQPNGDEVNVTTPLQTACDLNKANLTVGAVTLQPVILAADGTHSGFIVIHATVAPVFVHRKTRRIRVGV